MTEKEARKRVKALKGYYNHLASFISVNLFLFVLNLVSSPGEWWFLLPLLGWGIGLFSHTVNVFGLFGRGGHDWEEQKMRELMGAGNAEADQLMKRLEKLEAAVTSPEWDQDVEGSTETGELANELRGKSDAELADIMQRINNLEIIAGQDEPQERSQKVGIKN